MPRRRAARVIQLGSGTPPMAPETRSAGRTASRSRNTAQDTSPALLALSRLTERQFQALVVAALRSRGFVVWTVPMMRLTTAGLPDLLFWHPELVGRLFCWELKTATGRVSPAQRRALAALAAVPGVDARIVRPADWPAVRDAIDTADVAAALAAIHHER